jgi:probable O-glycosylation ligase (exosortase A-associated)
MFTLAVGLIIAVLALYAIVHPWAGILGWTWVSMMNPHVLTWRLADMPVAAAIAVGVLIGLVVTKDKRNFALTRESAVLLIFMLWMCITLPFSMDFEGSLPLWKRVMKIDVMILVALVLLHSKRHIMLLTWVLVGSLAFYGVKGGIFTLATGGNHRVWGPEGTYIGGNNEIALALILAIPLMRFLQLTTDKFWVRHSLTATMLLCAVAAIGSYSRGAFVAIAAMGALLWWRGGNRLAMGLAVVASGAALLAFMPEGWELRMSTIRTYEEDDSAMQRLNAWSMAWNIAMDRVFGAGFMVSTPQICAIYSPIPTDCRAAHSIYFMVLGEHGFVGLFLFLLLWVLVWRSAGHLRVEAAKQPETRWLAVLGAMAQVSLAGYAVGGAFLSLSYFDLPYNILVLVVVGRRWFDGKAWIEEARLKSETQTARLPQSPTIARRER